MRRTGLLIGGGLAVTAYIAVTSATADITGSLHDFSGQVWSQNQICLPCHAPHHAESPEAGMLWNHTVTTAAYQIYGGDGATFPVDEALDQKSILCMSCHDGTIAVDAFGGLGGTFVISGRGNLGTDLQNDHPVGRAAVYPTHGGYFDPATWENTAGFGFQLADMDVDGDLERVVSCATCHEPHNRNNNEFFLWVDNDGSQLCLTCHNK